MVRGGRDRTIQEETMNQYRNTDTATATEVRLAVLVAAILAVAAFTTGCTAPKVKSPDREVGTISLSVLGGVTPDMDLEPLSGFKGDFQGARLQLRVPSPDFSNIEMGLRGTVTRDDLEAFDGLLRSKAWQGDFGPSLRYYFTDRDSEVRPYLEGFGGVSYADRDGFVPSLGASGHAAGWGWHAGGGVGVEFRLSDDWWLQVGGEYTRSDLSLGSIAHDQDSWGIHLGFSIDF